eukprot:scaffold657004_cov62-Prasinocladus_malaysianus.AAC.1
MAARYHKRRSTRVDVMRWQQANLLSSNPTNDNLLAESGHSKDKYIVEQKFAFSTNPQCPI